MSRITKQYLCKTNLDKIIASGKESNFTTKLDRFKKSNDTFFLQFKNEASFLDFSSLGNEIQNTSIENINEIDFGRYKDNCDKFLNFANKGMLNETGIA